ncbi:outer membrane beta-barrel domain-containing protein [bacterium]|nr:outer membrane beta-barrel domain-containing protein [bacterium]
MNRILFFALFLINSLSLLGEDIAVQKLEKEEKIDAINVIQKKIIQNKNKVELFPAFGISINDPFLQTFSFAGALGFHFQENFYIELFGGVSRTIDQASAKELQKESNTAPELAFYEYFGDLNFVWIPISGKFSFLDYSILYFELYLTSGLGYLKTNVTDALSMNIGLGQKYYLSNWLAFRFEIKDHIYTEYYKNIIVSGNEKQTAKVMSHFLNVYMGISLFFP